MRYIMIIFSFLLPVLKLEVNYGTTTTT